MGEAKRRHESGEMPSLTPNEDAWRAEAPPADIMRETVKPGREGTMARIIVAVMNCQGQTMAREHDLGSDRMDIVNGFAQAIGNSIVGLAFGLSEDPANRLHNVMAVAERVNAQVGFILDMPSRDLDAVSVTSDIKGMARA